MSKFTIHVPYIEPVLATQWHPTEPTGPFAVLTRGAFETIAEAVAWARKHLDGTPYSIKPIEIVDYDAPVFYAWTAEIAVAAVVVADGFDLTDDCMHRMVSRHLGWPSDAEIRCKVLTRPADHDVATEQGYKTVEAYLADRRDR